LVVIFVDKSTFYALLFKALLREKELILSNIFMSKQVLKTDI